MAKGSPKTQILRLNNGADVAFSQCRDDLGSVVLLIEGQVVNLLFGGRVDVAFDHRVALVEEVVLLEFDAKPFGRSLGDGREGSGGYKDRCDAGWDERLFPVHEVELNRAVKLKDVLFVDELFRAPVFGLNDECLAVFAADEVASHILAALDNAVIFDIPSLRLVAPAEKTLDRKSVV